jgi:GNAT superfamily N-acetyltransferase
VVTIAPAQPADIEAIAALLDELNRFYGGTTSETPDEQTTQIREALFADTGAALVLLAWDDSSLVGLASYSFLWPATALTRSLFLKELYVAKSHRNRGVGRLLMDALHNEAITHRCSRVEWMTDSDNVTAQRFYEHLGAQPDSGKIFYRHTLQ